MMINARKDVVTYLFSLVTCFSDPPSTRGICSTSPKLSTVICVKQNVPINGQIKFVHEVEWRRLYLYDSPQNLNRTHPPNRLLRSLVYHACPCKNQLPRISILNHVTCINMYINLFENINSKVKCINESSIYNIYKKNLTVDHSYM